MKRTSFQRLRLQFEHVQDMIREQNRMEIAQIEPTDSERADMLSLLTAIKSDLESSSPSILSEFSELYSNLKQELSQLGYNVSSYDIVIREEASPASQMGKLSSGAANTVDTAGAVAQVKHVHFEDEPSSTSPLFADDLSEAAITEAANPVLDTGISYQDEEMDSTQLYDENQLLIEDQDRRLHEISRSVGRQRELGEDINTELGTHNDLLYDVEAQVDQSQVRLDRAGRGVASFNRRSREWNTCWIIMILTLVLFILIIL